MMHHLIFNLMKIGNYCDVGILFRSLLESFIVYKYFILNKDGTGLLKYYEVDYTKKEIIRINFFML